MKQEIIKRLFSKEELYFNENIHQRLFSKIHSVLMDRRADRLLDQDEYLVQATVNDFLSNHLRNTEFSAHREWQHIDNAVLHKATEEPMVLYEIKTFIKKQEVRINKKAILQDVLKLAIKKKKYPSIEAYMLIAGKIEVIKPALISDHLLLPNKFGDVYNRASMTLSLSHLKEVSVKEDLIDKAERLGIKTISISPSRWRQYDGMCVISWRINKL